MTRTVNATVWAVSIDCSIQDPDDQARELSQENLEWRGWWGLGQLIRAVGGEAAFSLFFRQAGLEMALQVSNDCFNFGGMPGRRGLTFRHSGNSALAYLNRSHIPRR